MRIISIDPGYERVGVAVLEKAASTRGFGEPKNAVLFSECFKTSPKLPLPERIFAIGQEIERVIKKWEPKALAIEKLFFAANQKTAMGVAEARGVIIYEGQRAGLKIFEYTPLQVKIAVTGYGKSDKKAVMMMVGKLIQKPDFESKSDDELDAVAIGLTCLAIEKFST